MVVDRSIAAFLDNLKPRVDSAAFPEGSLAADLWTDARNNAQARLNAAGHACSGLLTAPERAEQLRNVVLFLQITLGAPDHGLAYVEPLSGTPDLLIGQLRTPKFLPGHREAP